MCKRMISSMLFTGLLFWGMVFAQGGTLMGTVSFEGEPPAPQPIKITKDAKVCGKEPHYDESLLVGENKGLQNVVVSVLNAPKGGDMSRLGSEFAVHQMGCVYTPHVLLVPVNAPLLIYNDDGILHNLHTYSKQNPSFNVSQPKFKKKVKKSFKYPELITIKCDVHGWMVGYIKVVDHPYHAITNEKGEYKIEGLPPGTYQVEFWHEKLGAVQKEVTIEAGKATTLDLSMSL